jgi:hypothetical protein
LLPLECIHDVPLEPFLIHGGRVFKRRTMPEIPMKTLRIILVALVVCVAVYARMCVWILRGRPPLDFEEGVGAGARSSILEWYETTERVPRRGLDVASVFHAMGNPRSPFRFRPRVSLGGPGGDGSVVVSYLGYVAVFAEQDGGWVFVGD